MPEYTPRLCQSLCRQNSFMIKCWHIMSPCQRVTSQHAEQVPMKVCYSPKAMHLGCAWTDRDRAVLTGLSVTPCGNMFCFFAELLHGAATSCCYVGPTLRCRTGQPVNAFTVMGEELMPSVPMCCHMYIQNAELQSESVSFSSIQHSFVSGSSLHSSCCFWLGMHLYLCPASPYGARHLSVQIVLHFHSVFTS